MRILLAAGVFYPDVGGPAIHVRKVALRLVKEGLEPHVVCYGSDPQNTQFGFKISRVSRNLPKLIQWLYYLALVLWYGAGSRVIYAFDPTAAGLPARVSALVFGKPFLIRVGGDPIWEREAEMGRRLLPMNEYYKQGLYLEDKPILFKIIKWILSGAEKLIVYNQNFKDFYHQYFAVDIEKIEVIKNPVFKREGASTQLADNPIILFAGRLVSYKNIPRVMKAFSNLERGKLVLIGAGPERDNLSDLAKSLGIHKRVEFINSLPQEALFEKIKEASVCIAPALSEFNPNFILESLSFGKPVVMSRGHGLSVDLPKYLEFNPMDERDIESKLSFVLNPQNYQKVVEDISKINLDQTWEDVTESHLKLIKKYL